MLVIHLDCDNASSPASERSAAEIISLEYKGTKCLVMLGAVKTQQQSLSRNNDLVTQTIYRASAVFFPSPDNLLPNCLM